MTGLAVKSRPADRGEQPAAVKRKPGRPAGVVVYDDALDYLRPLVCPDTGERFVDVAEAFTVTLRTHPGVTAGMIIAAARHPTGKLCAGRYWDFQWPRDHFGHPRDLPAVSSSFVILHRMNSAHARGEHYAGGVE